METLHYLSLECCIRQGLAVAQASACATGSCRDTLVRDNNIEISQEPYYKFEEHCIQ